MEAQTAQRVVDETPIPESAPLARIPEVMPASAPMPERAVPDNIAAAAMRAEVQTFTCSPEIDQLAIGLAAAQLAFGAVEKTLTAYVKSKKEGAQPYSYDYAPLSEVIAAIRPALNANGIALLQPPGLGRTTVALTTLLVHGPSGQWFRSDIRFPYDVEHIDPQAFGTLQSYLRRYSLLSIAGVAPEAMDSDDDAAAVTGRMRQGSNGNGHKPAAPATTVSMPQRASVMQAAAPVPPTPPLPGGFLLTSCTKQTTPKGVDYWQATWRGKEVVAFAEVGAALEKAFRSNRPIKELRTHDKPASVGAKVFCHVDEIVFAGGAS